MKAVVYERYGPPDVLQLKEVKKPYPGKNEVLVKVRAVGVNASDWEMLRGKPLYGRFMGPFKPVKKILGSDIAGIVEAVGKNVKRFKPGDEVFGDLMGIMGGFAEYVCAPENVLMIKPPGFTFEEVAVLPQSLSIAIHGIRNKGQVLPGQKVLINGAGGGGGTFAVQLAKYYEAEVTGVDNAGKQDMLRSIGADHVIDYTKENYTRSGKRYDLILDMVAYGSVFAYKGALSARGMYYMVGGSMTTILQILFFGPCIKMLEGKKLSILLARAKPEDFDFMTELIKAGKIKLVIDKHFPLIKVPEALLYLGEGHVKGKIVITV